MSVPRLIQSLINNLTRHAQTVNTVQDMSTSTDRAAQSPNWILHANKKLKTINRNAVKVRTRVQKLGKKMF